VAAVYKKKGKKKSREIGKKRYNPVLIKELFGV